MLPYMAARLRFTLISGRLPVTTEERDDETVDSFPLPTALVTDEQEEDAGVTCVGTIGCIGDDAFSGAGANAGKYPEDMGCNRFENICMFMVSARSGVLLLR